MKALITWQSPNRQPKEVDLIENTIYDRRDDGSVNCVRVKPIRDRSRKIVSYRLTFIDYSGFTDRYVTVESITKGNFCSCGRYDYAYLVHGEKPRYEVTEAYFKQVLKEAFNKLKK